MSKPKDSTTDPPPPRRRKRRWKWLRRFGIVLVVLVALALAINGPIARWLVGKVLTDQLAKQGLEGSVKVEGRLWSGFTLKEASFEGEESIARIKFDELGVEYSLFELREKKIRRVFGRAVDVELNLKEKDQDKEKKKPEFAKIAESLRKVRELLVPVEIGLESVTVTVNRPEKDPLRLSLGSLRHEAGRDDLVFGGIASNVLGEEGLPNQDFTLTWEQHAIQLTEVELLPQLAVPNVRIAYPPGDPLSLTGTVQAGAARLDLAANESGAIDLTMKDGPLVVEEIVSAYDPELELAGSITKLQLAAENLFEGKDDWTIDLELAGEKLKWPGGGGLSELSLHLTGKEDVQLALMAAGHLSLDAQAPRPDLSTGSLADAWKKLPVRAKLQSPSLHKVLRDVNAAVGKEVVKNLEGIPEGAITLEGDLVTGGELGVAPADMKWNFSEIVFQKKSVPDLQGTLALADGLAKVSATLAQPRLEETVALTADWNLETKTYDGTLNIKLPDPAWIDAFIPGTSPDWRPTGPVALDWSGRGSFPQDAPAKHAGSLKVINLTLTAPEDTTTKIALAASYDWPGTIELTSLDVRNGDLWLEGAIKWADDRLAINTLRLHDQTGPLAHLEGSLPLTTETLAAKKFFAQEKPLDLAIESRELRLQRLVGLLPLKLPPGFAAKLNANLKIAGTPAQPTLSGSFKASEVDTPGPEKLPLLAAEINFATGNKTLTATGEVTEPGGRVVALNASVPFEIGKLLNDPAAFKKLPLNATATIEDFKLQRLQLLAPALAQAEGTLNGEFRIAGTVDKPVLSGGTTVDLVRYPVPGAPFGEIGKSKLAVRLEGDRIIIDRSPITAAGGTIALSGTVTMVEGKPQFDMQIDAESALVWRDDNVLMRTSGRLTLTGSMEEAQVRGDLGIIESLLYKDIEIIPLGLPAAGAPKPQLPSFDRATTSALGGIPEPFANWGLDIGIATPKTDPILIRGNIATGRITASTRIKGTVGNPRPEGSINLENAEAALPLSKLTVRQGKITLRPEQPFDPVIDMRGTTTINSYRISLYLFGPISDPKYDLFSDPPLPEAEILTLIATGTTTGGLQDQDTATMKAFQLAITEIKRRLSKPGSDSIFQKFLDTLEVVDIRMGDNDPFQGRKFTSATLQLNRFLFFSAAVDREGQTRGVVMFAPQPDDEEARGLLQEPGGKGKKLPPSKIRVTGLRSLRPETALSAIAGRLEYIEDRPSTDSRADDAAFLLERFLRQQGFTDPEVNWSIPQPGRIVLAVEEGPRSSLGKIYVQGVKDELFDGVRKQMQAAHEGRSRLPGTDIPYLPENNAPGLKNSTSLLNSEGYWAAKVELHRIQRDPRTGRTDLHLKVIPGPRHNLGAVDAPAGTPLREELLTRLRSVEGKVAKTKVINQTSNTVGRFYRNRGYQNATVTMRATHEAGITRLSFRVTLGKVFKIDEVAVEGLQRTDPAIVERRFAGLAGQNYSREDFDDEIRKLFGTGAFAGIRLEERPQLDGTIDVTLHFREGKPDGYQFYTGVGSFEGFILGAGYYHRNLMGRLWNFSTRAEYSGIGLLGEASVTDPFFLGYDLRFTPRAFIQTRTYEGYKKFESGLGVQLAWDVTDHYKMELDWTTSLVSLNDDGLPEQEIGPNTYLLNVLGLTQTYDRRNDLAVPTDGYYATLTTDVGLSLGEGAVSFVRAEAHASVYEPVTKKSHVAVGARAGIIVPSASDTGLPVDLRYFLGGANSVRSFPARELGPEAINGLPRGGESYWVANAEFVHSLIGPVNGVIFLDAGSLSRDHGELFAGETKYAGGLGLRLHLPIGAVRLEYGHALNPEPNEPNGAFHFAIGAAF